MASRPAKTYPEERRRAEAGLSEFAAYVEQQQLRRQAAAATATATAAATATATTTSTTNTTTDSSVESSTTKAIGTPTATATSLADDEHAELDALFDELDLTGAKPKVPLRGLYLGADPSSDKLWTAPDHQLDQLQASVTQRLDEGHGEAVFDIGFENHGESMALTRQDYARALARLIEAAKRAGADCDVLLTRNVGGPVDTACSVASDATGTLAPATTPATTGSSTAPTVTSSIPPTNTTVPDCTAKVLVRKVPLSPTDAIETRIAVVGNVDAGKSSMVGVLVKGDLDDGRGKARVNLFRHKHEVESGRTSSVGLEILGFDSKGAVIRSDTPGSKCVLWFWFCIYFTLDLFFSLLFVYAQKTRLCLHTKNKPQENSAGRMLQSAAPR